MYYVKPKYVIENFEIYITVDNAEVNDDFFDLTAKYHTFLDTMYETIIKHTNEYALIGLW